MATTAHKHPNYMAIFWWLAILTVVELAVVPPKQCLHVSHAACANNVDAVAAGCRRATNLAVRSRTLAPRWARRVHRSATT